MTSIIFSGLDKRRARRMIAHTYNHTSLEPLRRQPQETLSAFAAQIFSPGRGASVEDFHGRAAPFVVRWKRGGDHQPLTSLRRTTTTHDAHR